MDNPEEEAIDIKPYIISSTRIYSLHEAFLQNQRYYAKVFYEELIHQQFNMEPLEYNEEVLTNTQDYLYPEHFLKVHRVYPHTTGFLFLTDPYECRLNQFLAKRKLLSEEVALQIFEKIFKCMYALYRAGYWHRHLRCQHFVKVGSQWKLQSLVFNNEEGKKGFKCEYVWSDYMQCPTFTSRSQKSDEQYDQKMVWDLGCILINLLYGSASLKSTYITKRLKQKGFSTQIFSFSENRKLSPKLQAMLNQMCNVNTQERIKVEDVLKSGYFSKQVSKQFQTHSEKRYSKIFVPNKSAITKVLSLVKENPQANFIYDTSVLYHRHEESKIQNIDEIMEVIEVEEEDSVKQQENEDREKYRLEIQEENKDKMYDLEEEKDEAKKLKEYSQKYSTIEEKGLSQNLKEKKILRLEEIQYKGEAEVILNYFKRNIEKCELLEYASEQIPQISDILPQKQKTKRLIFISSYALNFVSMMELNNMIKVIEDKKYVQDYSDQENSQFYKCNHNQLLKLINFRKGIKIMNLAKLQKKFQTIPTHELIQDEPLFKIFLQTNGQQCEFKGIKAPFRKVIKKVYDLISNHYTYEKNRKWAEIGLILTFCICIEKLFLKKFFFDNFKTYFEWSKEKEAEYISVQEMKKYLQKGNRCLLVKHSRQLILKFFQI